MPSPTLFSIGFRPFFLGAILYAIAAMGLWTAIYSLQLPLPLYPVNPVSWHGHEMIYGYAMAVVAGFLLTAIGNWTGIRTLHGYPLALLLLAWLAARALPLCGSKVPIAWVASFDLLFMLGLTAAASAPIIKARSSANYAIIGKLVLLCASNLVFYLGIFEVINDGVRLGLYSGLYLVLALVLTIGRRVLPFFIERASEKPLQLRNRRWLDLSSLVAFLLFWLAELWLPFSTPAALLAALLFVLHSIRLAGWYHGVIWQQPLLWVLYLAYLLLTLSFAFKAISIALQLNPLLALHAFAMSGIASMTLGMMARIALGHTGRNIYATPRILGPIFCLLFASGVVRVVLPLLWPAQYQSWILLAQVLWIASFTIFALVYLPILVGPRADGKPG